MPGRKIIFAFCLICLFSSGSRAQQPPRTKPASDASRAPQPVPPPPKPADDGPSLEVTMKLIQDKLNGMGTLRWTVTTRNDALGIGSGSSYETLELSNAVADTQRCTISYHTSRSERMIGEKQENSNEDPVLHLREVEKITVKSLEQIFQEISSNDWVMKVSPPVFVVRFSYLGHKRMDELIVDDEELANRLARAINHAVELCTPDKKSEPF